MLDYWWSRFIYVNSADCFGTHEERRSISIVKDGKSRIWWGWKSRANSEEGEIQPKGHFALVLLPGNEFKEQRVSAHQGEPPVWRRCTCCSSNGRGECGVSCVCSVNGFQVCSPFQRVTVTLLDFFFKLVTECLLFTASQPCASYFI